MIWMNPFLMTAMTNHEHGILQGQELADISLHSSGVRYEFF